MALPPREEIAAIIAILASGAWVAILLFDSERTDTPWKWGDPRRKEQFPTTLGGLIPLHPFALPIFFAIIGIAWGLGAFD